MGGIDIEEVAEKHPEHVSRTHFSTLVPFAPYIAKQAISATGVTGDDLTKLILSKPGVKKIAVMMNVVSNTRVDIVARGVIKGCVESGRNPADTIAIFRIPGAWEDDGFKILKKYGVEYCDRTVSMYEAAGRAVAKMK